MKRTLRAMAAVLLVALLATRHAPVPPVALAAEGAPGGALTEATATGGVPPRASTGEAAQGDARAERTGGEPTAQGEERAVEPEQAAADGTRGREPTGEETGEVAVAESRQSPARRSPTPDGSGSAYAVYDPMGCTLTFLRSYDEVEDGPDQTITDICGNAHTGQVWGGVEDLDASSAEEVPWHEYADPYYGYQSVSVADGCTISPRSCAWWFEGALRLGPVDLTGLDTSRCASFAHMFDGCSNLRSLDLSGLETSSATSMAYMFNYCRALSSLDPSGFDTAGVTDMSHMFCQCEQLASLDLSRWDTGRVTDMNSMFSLCYRLSSLDISGWDTGNVTDMGHMLSALHSMAHIPTEHVDTRSATNLSYMLAGEWIAERLDVSHFDTGSATDMSRMFATCLAITDLDLSNFDTSRVTDMTYMFQNCEALEHINLSSFDMSSVETADRMFNACPALSSVDLGAGFQFLAGSTTHNYLTTPPDTDAYTRNWCNTADETQSLRSVWLSARYDGATMAGTWEWETSHTCPLTLDLGGGRAPEGQEYPTEYRIGRELAIPGTYGSELGNPTRYGYSFVRWVDEDGGTVGSIDGDSRGPRTITAEWRAWQIVMRAPVSISMRASQLPDGALALEPEEGDFSYEVYSMGSAPVAVTASATPAEGFSLRDAAQGQSDLEADVWMTPVTTRANVSAEGYDPAADGTYREYGEVRLSGLGDGARVGPVVAPWGSFWLNKVGGRMGGWSTNPGTKTLLASINWTFSLAPEE